MSLEVRWLIPLINLTLRYSAFVSSVIIVCLGVLDFYFFMGSGPDEVLYQYFDVIGRPAMPPYWALGFHQCRFGYENIQAVKDVIENFAKYEVCLKIREVAKNIGMTLKGTHATHLK